MKVLQKNEWEQFWIMRNNRSLNISIYNELAILQCNEALKLEKDEWKSLAHPATTLGRWAKLSNKKFSVRNVGGGWLIIRLK